MGKPSGKLCLCPETFARLLLHNGTGWRSLAHHPLSNGYDLEIFSLLDLSFPESGSSRGMACRDLHVKGTLGASGNGNMKTKKHLRFMSSEISQHKFA